MTVSIDLDLKAGDVHTELAAIKTEMEALDDSFDLDGMDFDGFGDTLDDLSDSLDQLTESMEDFNKSADKLEDLDLDGFRPGGERRDGGDSGGDTGSDSGDKLPGRNQGYSIVESVKILAKDVDVYGPGGGGSGFGFSMPDGDGGGGGFGGFGSAARAVGSASPSALGSGKSGSGGGRGLFSRLNDKMRKLRNLDIGKKFRSAIPSMRMWYSLLAAIIPILAVFVVQALGVASAMAAVATAGAAVIGLGLLGHGDNLAESMKNARKQISSLGKQLFKVFQPTAQAFAPIQERLFDRLPQMLSPLAEAMKELTAFEDIIFTSFRGISQWMANGIEGIANNEQMVSQLTERFGALLGKNIADFFKFITEEAYKNQDGLVELGKVLKDIGIILYDLFLIASKLFTGLAPLFNALKWITSLIKNPLAAALTAFIAIMAAAVWMTISLSQSIMSLGTLIAGGSIPAFSALQGMLASYVPQALSAAMANYALAESLATVIGVATLGVGLGLAGYAGFKAYKGMKQAKKIEQSMDNGGGGIPTRGGSRGGETNIINEGDKYEVNVGSGASTADREKVTDEIRLNNRTDQSRNLEVSNNSMSGGSTSTNSDSGGDN